MFTERSARAQAPTFAIDRTRLLWFAAIATGSILSLWTLIALTERTWIPTFDNALIWFRASDVGTKYSPLVGPYSRFGWDHPGPMLYYVLAIPLRLLAMRPTGLLVGAFGIALLSSCALVHLVWNHAGRAAGIIAAVGVALLSMSLGDRLIEPWNPYILVLPFAVFIAGAWIWSSGKAVGLPAALLGGTFAAQCHVGVVPAVCVIGATSLLLRLLRPPSKVPGSRAVTAFFCIVTALLWLPPLWQQLTMTPANISQLVRFFFTGAQSGDALGWRTGLGLAAAELLPWGSWIGRQHLGMLSNIEPAPYSGLVAPFLLWSFTLYESYRQRDDTMLRYSIIIASALFSCVWSYAHIHGVVLSYLIVWPHAVVMFTVAGPVLVLARHADAPTSSRGSVLLRYLAMSTVCGILSVRALSATSPDAFASHMHRYFAEAIANAVPAKTLLRVVATGVPFTVSPEAVAITLIRANREPRLQPWESRVPGAHRCVSAAALLPTLALASGPGIEDLQRLGRGGKMLASYDPLSPRLRALTRQWRDELVAQLTQAKRDDLIRPLDDGAEWLLGAAPAGDDRALLADYVRLACGDKNRAYALLLFPPSTW